MGVSQEAQSSGNDVRRLRELVNGLHHWLELFDLDFACREVPLSQRPLMALIHLLSEGAIDVRIGDKDVDVSKPHEHCRSNWFRLLFEAVSTWYSERFGAAAMKSGVLSLVGAVLIHSSAFALAVPSRTSVEVEGQKAWLHFEDSLHPAETAGKWITKGPDLAAIDPVEKRRVLSDADKVADTLRFLDFRRLTARTHSETKASQFVLSMMTHIQGAARRMVSGSLGERGPAWFDLQMARETALKAVIAQASGDAPHTHDLKRLLASAAPHGAAWRAGLAVQPVDGTARFPDVVARPFIPCQGRGDTRRQRHGCTCFFPIQIHDPSAFLRCFSRLMLADGKVAGPPPEMSVARGWSSIFGDQPYQDLGNRRYLLTTGNSY